MMRLDPKTSHARHPPPIINRHIVLFVCIYIRHGSFHSIHHQTNPIDHGQDAIHFSGKIRVTGCIDNIQHVGISRTSLLVIDPRDFGGNGNPPFLFQISRIHESIQGFRLGVVIGVTFLRRHEQFVHEGGFPVIDVRNNGHIAQSLSSKDLIICFAFGIFFHYRCGGESTTGIFQTSSIVVEGKEWRLMETWYYSLLSFCRRR
mmetsp:Transcript_8006/g.16698  ORF Transcript_8006/g.16698 Transcript_8006/m.16698 type:complete len:203 (+) Transcript_8006:1001-1609(+)